MKTEQFQDYLVEYYHNKSSWILKIRAASPEDAQERCRQIYYAKILGTVEMEIPVRLGIFAHLGCWLRNLLSA